MILGWMIDAIFLILSAVATDEPPNFSTFISARLLIDKSAKLSDVSQINVLNKTKLQPFDSE
jgi:hypothetical protein